MIVGFVGIQGDTTTGIQGIGVKTPRAAAVADATIGFDKVEHIPNGIMFSIGMKSTVVAAGRPQIRIGNFGGTMRLDGVVPNEHLHIAPQTPIGTYYSLKSVSATDFEGIFICLQINRFKFRNRFFENLVDLSTDEYRAEILLYADSYEHFLFRWIFLVVSGKRFVFCKLCPKVYIATEVFI